MLVDAQSTFTDTSTQVTSLNAGTPIGQTLPGAAGTTNSTNILDSWGSAQPVAPGMAGLGMGTGLVMKDQGRGGEVELDIRMLNTPTGLTSIQVQLWGSDAADYATGALQFSETIAVPLASLVAGYVFRLDLPPGMTKRYLFLKFVQVGVAGTQAVIFAGLVSDRHTGQFVG